MSYLSSYGVWCYLHVFECSYMYLSLPFAYKDQTYVNVVFKCYISEKKIFIIEKYHESKYMGLLCMEREDYLTNI